MPNIDLKVSLQGIKTAINNLNALGSRIKVISQQSFKLDSAKESSANIQQLSDSLSTVSENISKISDNKFSQLAADAQSSTAAVTELASSTTAVTAGLTTTSAASANVSKNITKTLVPVKTLAKEMGKNIADTLVPVKTLVKEMGSVSTAFASGATKSKSFSAGLTESIRSEINQVRTLEESIKGAVDQTEKLSEATRKIPFAKGLSEDTKGRIDQTEKLTEVIDQQAAAKKRLNQIQKTQSTITELEKELVERRLILRSLNESLQKLQKRSKTTVDLGLEKQINRQINRAIDRIKVLGREVAGIKKKISSQKLSLNIEQSKSTKIIDTEKSLKKLVDTGKKAKIATSDISEGLGGLNAIAAVVSPEVGQVASVMGALKIGTVGANQAIKELLVSLKGSALALLNPTLLAAVAALGLIALAYKEWTDQTKELERIQEKQNKTLQETIDKTDELNKKRLEQTTPDQKLLAQFGRSVSAKEVKNLNESAAVVSSLGLVSQEEAKKRLLQETPFGKPLDVKKTLQSIALEIVKTRKINESAAKLRQQGATEAEISSVKSQLESLPTSKTEADKKEASKILQDLLSSGGGTERKKEFRKEFDKANSELLSQKALADKKLIDLEEKQKKNPVRLHGGPGSGADSLFPATREKHAEAVKLEKDISTQKELVANLAEQITSERKQQQITFNNSTVFFGQKTLGANTLTPPSQRIIP